MLQISSMLTKNKAIVELADQAMIGTMDDSAPQRPSIFPVKGCMFFGVPHRGADVAGVASRFLSVLAPVFNVNKNSIRDLEPKSQRFANVSSEFRSVQSTWNIPIISFYETVKYNHDLGFVSSLSTFCENITWHSRTKFASFL